MVVCDVIEFVNVGVTGLLEFSFRHCESDSKMFMVGKFVGKCR